MSEITILYSQSIQCLPFPHILSKKLKFREVKQFEGIMELVKSKTDLSHLKF